MVAKDEKEIVIGEFQLHETDTGSVEVQIASLTKNILRLRDHFAKHTHDASSQRGLMKMVNRRRKFLEYVKRHDVAAYKEIIERLGLRK